MQPLYKRIPTWTSYVLGNLLTILCYDYCLFSWLMDVRQTAAVNHGGTCSGLNWKVFIVSFYELVEPKIERKRGNCGKF